MSDRYGYDDGFGNREDDVYDRYGEWHDSYLGTSRSSNGAGAYSNRTSNRRKVDYEDGAYERSSRASTSRSSRRSTSRSSSGEETARSSERRSSRSHDTNIDSRLSASDRSARQSAHRTADPEARTSHRSASGHATRSGARRQADEAASASRSHQRRAASASSHSTSTGSEHDRRATARRAHADVEHRSSARSRSSEPAASRYSRSSYGSASPHADAPSKRSVSRSGHAANGAASSSSSRSADDAVGAGVTASSKRSNKKRNIVVAAVVAVAVILIGAISAFAYVNSITGSLHEGVDQDLRNALVETDMANEPFYMLLLGTDKVEWREGTEEGGLYRSDTMILARVDAPNGTMTLISIPRDTLVDMGEYGWQKINAAYGLGGPSLAVEAVTKLTGVDISHYAEVDMDGLAAVVDAIGGVEVEVPVEIDDEDAGGYVPAGWQTLDGEHALIVCRSRNTFIETSAAPDLMRAANQRMVLSAIAHKVLGSDIATIANTVRSAAEFVTTDLELNDIIGLAQAMQGMDTDDAFYTASLPTRSAYIVNGLGYADNVSGIVTDTVDPSILEGWYMLLEEKEWSSMKGRMSEGKPPAEGVEIDEATGIVLSTAGSDAEDISSKYAWITLMNGTDREGLATRVMGMLNADGFENITLEDAPYGYDYPETLVIYDEPGRAREAQQIVDAMGQGKAMQNDGSWVVANNFLVVIGDDWQGSTSSASSSSASASASSAAASSR